MDKCIINLSDDGRVNMTAYLHEKTAEASLFEKRPAVLICPGGGYEVLAFREGEPVALEFLARGFNVFLLNYSVGCHALFPNPVIDGAKAIRAIRKRHAEYGVDPGKIAICGFSAGGHLCACLSSMWRSPKIYEAAGAAADEIRPDASILCYPCISADMQGLGRMYRTVMPGAADDEIEREMSAELHVGAHNPPAFLFHTFADNTVPVEHSLRFAAALARADVPFELHVYPDGPHALALGSFLTANGVREYELPHVAAWFPMAADWLWRVFGKPDAQNPIPPMFAGKKRAKFGG